jgi:hypothetical protein
VALLPQLVLPYLPSAAHVPAGAASLSLPLSLVVFLAFVWANRGLAGMPILLIGLILNLLVISSNGGWMPISPATARNLPGGSDAQQATLGRFGQKDVLLPDDTRLNFYQIVSRSQAGCTIDGFQPWGRFHRRRRILAAGPSQAPQNSKWSEPC